MLNHQLRIHDLAISYRTEMSFMLQNIRTAFAIFTFALLYGTQTNAPSSSVTILDSGKIVQFLSHTISWYRELAVEQKNATEPSDLTFVQENRRVADQIVQLAFEFSRNQAQLQSRQPAQPQSPSDSGSQSQRLVQALQKIGQQIQDTQAELQSVREKMASGARRPALVSQAAELQSELGLLDARRDAMESMVEFVNSSSSGNSGGGLRAQIEELARSVPAALSRTQGATQSETTTEPSSS